MITITIEISGFSATADLKPALFVRSPDLSRRVFIVLTKMVTAKLTRAIERLEKTP